MRSIVLVSNFETQNWKFCLNHHGISFVEVDYWEKPTELYHFKHTTIILDHGTLDNLFRYQRNHLENILSCNKILLVGFSDSPVMFRDFQSLLREIDIMIQSSNIICVLECDTFDHDLKNIQIDFDPVSKFFDLSEQRVSIRLEKNYSRDFLLCMGRSDSARDLLWSRVQEVQNHQSVMIYHGANPSHDNQWNNYIGENSAPLLWQRSLVPSLDLYNDCCFEIAAETFADRIRWFTEKTIRPIAAKTPFVALGAPGLLRSLHGLGFKTFGSLIDESYDSEDDLHKRVDKIGNIVQDIITNGSAEFAQASQSITEHNWNQLAMIKGSFHLKKDRRYFDLL